MPRDLPRFGDEIENSRRQRRHVQRLANRANALRSTAVVVDKNAPTGKIQQRNAA